MNIVIHTPTSKPEDSFGFYEKLGFHAVSRESPVLFSDGKAVVEVNPDRFARAGIKCYKPSWTEEVAKLSAITAVTKFPGGYLLSDSGVWIYLAESAPAAIPPAGDSSSGIPGNFMGLSVESTDMARSESIYKLLGFSASGSAEQGWISLDYEGFVINLMKPLSCPHLFFNPSMTYFNGGKNLPVIEKIRSLGIPVTEEITHFNKEGIVDNIIIRDPGGYGFFIFND